MGFTPEQVDRMALREFAACLSGYAEAHGGKRDEGPAVDLAEHDLRAMGVEGF